MKVFNEKQYKEYKQAHTTEFGCYCIKFAESWANSLEKHMVLGEAPGDTIIKYGIKTLQQVFKKYDPTELLYECALCLLLDEWSYRKELRAWLKGRHLVIMDGVVNDIVY